MGKIIQFPTHLTGTKDERKIKKIKELITETNKSLGLTEKQKQEVLLSFFKEVKNIINN